MKNTLFAAHNTACFLQDLGHTVNEIDLLSDLIRLF